MATFILVLSTESGDDHIEIVRSLREPTDRQLFKFLRREYKEETFEESPKTLQDLSIYIRQVIKFTHDKVKDL